METSAIKRGLSGVNDKSRHYTIFPCSLTQKQEGAMVRRPALCWQIKNKPYPKSGEALEAARIACNRYMANYIGNDGFHLEAGSDWTGSAFCSMQMETMHKRLSEG
ncbi:hypothetical protein NC651_009153 [Populus alba x Populus x berolinensis]|nr:hypothetical protein NC651_009153 [Populus alba x Populus x berolinensis]